jgi:hypothetical protein
MLAEEATKDSSLLSWRRASPTAVLIFGEGDRLACLTRRMIDLFGKQGRRDAPRSN